MSDEQASPKTESDQKINILIVDDRPEGLLTLEAVLSEPDYRLVRASSGSEALRKLLEHDFALILLDVQMPGLDGFETAEIIKQRERSREIPIIFITAISKEERFVYQGYEVGAVDYVFKPFDPHVLRSKVSVFAQLYRANMRLKAQAELLHEAEVRERKRQLAQYQLESLQRYRNLADAIPHLVWRSNRQLKMEYFNQSWIAYTGLSLEDSGGKGWHSAIHPECLLRLEELWEKALDTGKETTIECRIRREFDGLYRWHIIRTVPEHDHRGQLVGWITSATDIHDRKLVEERNLGLLEDLQEAIKARDEFLSVASHELKTPLTPLRLQTQNVIRLANRVGWDHLPAEKIAKILEVTDRQVDRLARLVDEMLDISRINVGRLELQKEDFDLAAMVRDVVERFSEQFKSVQCEIKLSADAEVVGSWDRFRIEQVVTNLLTNAMKYGPSKPVEIRVEVDSGRARLVVRDHGIGIAHEDQARIFGRFERAVSAKHFGGLGLGLYIVQQIIERHEGKIWVESTPGDGSTFFVELPIAQEQQGAGLSHVVAGAEEAAAVKAKA